MIRRITILIACACLGAWTLQSASAQNLYDARHTAEFAGFLYQNQQYEPAAREYERLLLLDRDMVPMEKLLGAYRLAGLTKAGLRRGYAVLPPCDQLSRPVIMEWLKLLMHDPSPDAYEQCLDASSHFLPGEKLLLKDVRLFLLNKSPGRYRGLPGDHDQDGIQARLLQEKLNSYSSESWKSPLLAGSMSAVLPGSGRIYTGDWKNGLVSLLFVGFNAYQSYRGFSRNGIESPGGWIFGTLAVGFYAGNIYGSVWSARRYNQAKHQKYTREVEHLFSRY